METKKPLAGLIASCIVWTLVTDDPKHHKPHIELKTSNEVGVLPSNYNDMTVTASGIIVSSSMTSNIEWLQGVKSEVKIPH